MSTGRCCRIIVSARTSASETSRRRQPSRQADKEFERKASAALSEQEGCCGSLATTAKRRKAELEAFQAKHKLSRRPTIRLPSRSFLGYAFWQVLILVEGLF